MRAKGKAYHTFLPQERDAILAGLRLLQNFSGEMHRAHPLSFFGNIREIFTNGNTHPGLELTEIDDLCGRLNT